MSTDLSYRICFNYTGRDKKWLSKIQRFQVKPLKQPSLFSLQPG